MYPAFSELKNENCEFSDLNVITKINSDTEYYGSNLPIKAIFESDEIFDHQFTFTVNELLSSSMIFLPGVVIHQEFIIHIIVILCFIFCSRKDYLKVKHKKVVDILERMNENSWKNMIENLDVDSKLVCLKSEISSRVPIQNFLVNTPIVNFLVSNSVGDNEMISVKGENLNVCDIECCSSILHCKNLLLDAKALIKFENKAIAMGVILARNIMLFNFHTISHLLNKKVKLQFTTEEKRMGTYEFTLTENEACFPFNNDICIILCPFYAILDVDRVGIDFCYSNESRPSTTDSKLFVCDLVHNNLILPRYQAYCNTMESNDERDALEIEKTLVYSGKYLKGMCGNPVFSSKKYGDKQVPMLMGIHCGNIDLRKSAFGFASFVNQDFMMCAILHCFMQCCNLFTATPSVEMFVLVISLIKEITFMTNQFVYTSKCEYYEELMAAIEISIFNNHLQKNKFMHEMADMNYHLPICCFDQADLELTIDLIGKLIEYGRENMKDFTSALYRKNEKLDELKMQNINEKISTCTKDRGAQKFWNRNDKLNNQEASDESDWSNIEEHAVESKSNKLKHVDAKDEDDQYALFKFVSNSTNGHSIEDNRSGGVRFVKNSADADAKMPLTTFQTDKSRTIELDGRAVSGFDNLNEKPIHLETGPDSLVERTTIAWTTTDLRGAILQEIRVPFGLLALGNSSSIQNMPFSSMAYWHGDVQINAQVNGTPFLAGQLVMIYAPYDGGAGPGGLSDYLNYQHAFISPQDSSTISMIIKYNAPTHAIPTNLPATNIMSTGTVYIVVLSPLKATTATSVRVTLYSAFPNSKFFLPRGITPMFLGPFSLNPAPTVKSIHQNNSVEGSREAPSKLRDSQRRHKFVYESPLKKFGLMDTRDNFDRLSKTIKFIKNGNRTSSFHNVNYDFTKSTPMGQISIGSATQKSKSKQTNSTDISPQTEMTALDDPTIESGTLPIAPVYSGMSATNVAHPAVGMSLTAGFNDEVPVFDDVDTNLNLNHVCGKEGILQAVEWSTTQIAGTSLYSCPLNSLLCAREVLGALPSNLTLINFFTFFRCDFVFVIRVVKTKWHSGRLRFVLAYASRLGPGEDTLYINEVADFKGDMESIEVVVKWNSIFEWLRTSENEDDRRLEYSLGTFGVHIATPLVSAPMVLNNVDVIISVKLQNVKVAVPKINLTVGIAGRTTSNTIPYSHFAYRRTVSSKDKSNHFVNDSDPQVCKDLVAKNFQSDFSQHHPTPVEKFHQKVTKVIEARLAIVIIGYSVYFIKKDMTEICEYAHLDNYLKSIKGEEQDRIMDGLISSDDVVPTTSHGDLSQRFNNGQFEGEKLRFVSNSADINLPMVNSTQDSINQTSAGKPDVSTSNHDNMSVVTQQGVSVHDGDATGSAVNIDDNVTTRVPLSDSKAFDVPQSYINPPTTKFGGGVVSILEMMRRYVEVPETLLSPVIVSGRAGGFRINVTPDLPFMMFFAAWKGSLEYRIFFDRTTNSIPAPQISFWPGLHAQAAFCGKGGTIQNGAYSYGNPVANSGHYGTKEILYPVSTTNHYIDVVIPFQTTFNYLLYGSNCRFAPAVVGQLCIELLTEVGTTINMRNVRVYLKAHDSFRPLLYRPSLSNICGPRPAPALAVAPRGAVDGYAYYVEI